MRLRHWPWTLRTIAFMAVSDDVLERAQRGDKAACLALLAESYPSVLRMARVLTGNATEADRVVDFVLTRGAKLLPAWRRGTMPQNWFYHHTLLAARDRAAAAGRAPSAGGSAGCRHCRRRAGVHCVHPGGARPARAAMRSNYPPPGRAAESQAAGCHHGLLLSGGREPSQRSQCGPGGNCRYAHLSPTWCCYPALTTPWGRRRSPLMRLWNDREAYSARCGCDDCSAGQFSSSCCAPWCWAHGTGAFNSGYGWSRGSGDCLPARDPA